jgi:hypothetical protein
VEVLLVVVLRVVEWSRGGYLGRHRIQALVAQRRLVHLGDRLGDGLTLVVRD